MSHPRIGQATGLRPSTGGGFICISGLGGVSGEWACVAESLKRRGRVLVLELPVAGDGSSSRAGSPLAAGHRLVREALARDGTHRPVLLGHSMGALAAILAAANEPARLAGLVLTAPFLPVARHGRSRIRTAADYGRHRALFIGETARRTPLRRESMTVRSRAAALRSLARYGLRPNSFHALADRVTCPVLLVHGSSDHYVPAAFASGAAERHPGWRLELVAGAGHFPHRDAPGAWLQAVEPWLDSLPAEQDVPATRVGPALGDAVRIAPAQGD